MRPMYNDSIVRTGLRYPPPSPLLPASKKSGREKGGGGRGKKFGGRIPGKVSRVRRGDGERGEEEGGREGKGRKRDCVIERLGHVCMQWWCNVNSSPTDVSPS